MNKNDLITSVAKATRASKKTVADIISTTFDTITSEIASGNKVQIAGFGTFEARDRASYAGRNPKTNEAVMIAECKVPSFKAGETLRKKLNA